MEHRSSQRRLAAFAVLCLAAGYVVFCLGQGALALDSWLYWNGMRGTRMTTDWQEAITRAMVLPFSDEATASLVRFGSPLDLGSPLEILFLMSGGVPLRATYWLLATALSGASFAALWQSRRVARIRPLHVVRPVVYFLPVMLTCFVTWTVSYSLRELVGYDDFLFEPSVFLYFLFRYAFPAITFLWWFVVIRLYLRMDHAWGVTIAVWLMGSLGAIVAFYLVNPPVILDPLSAAYRAIAF